MLKAKRNIWGQVTWLGTWLVPLRDDTSQITAVMVSRAI